ncbi:hypothetical protein GCM10028790_65440 [Micromonospora taraxaci]
MQDDPVPGGAQQRHCGADRGRHPLGVVEVAVADVGDAHVAIMAGPRTPAVRAERRGAGWRARVGSAALSAGDDEGEPRWS